MIVIRQVCLTFSTRACYRIRFIGTALPVMEILFKLKVRRGEYFTVSDSGSLALNRIQQDDFG